MATRCNVIVSDSRSNTKIFLYRHWDGYPGETGADLIEHLKKALAERNTRRGFRAFAQSLISAKRGGEGHDKDSPQYEVTDCIHGDIEHLYEIAFNAGRENKHTTALITHSMRHCGEEKFGARIHLTLEEFVGMVNADRAAMNERIKVLRVSGGKHYADIAEYPMVAL